MKTRYENFVSVLAVDEEKSIENQECYTDGDPFSDVNHDVEATKYYRLNEEVFAEPLKSNIDMQKPKGESEKESPADITFIGNIGVQKRAGKNNKYFIDVGDLTNLTCPQQNCHKSFTSRTLLKAHVRKVHCADRNSFVCERCAAGFPARYLLRRHSAVHGGERVRCPVCEKTLSLRTSLSTHLRSHSGDRPHICACGKKFVRKSALRRHETFVHKDGV